MVERINVGHSSVSSKPAQKRRVSKGETVPISDLGISVDSKNAPSNTQSAKRLYLPDNYMDIIRRQQQFRDKPKLKFAVEGTSYNTLNLSAINKEPSNDNSTTNVKTLITEEANGRDTFAISDRGVTNELVQVFTTN